MQPEKTVSSTEHVLPEIKHPRIEIDVKSFVHNYVAKP